MPAFHSEPAKFPSDKMPALAERLARELDAEVRFDPGSRALYATDASNYRWTPLGVVLPRDTAALARAVEICRDYDMPVMHRGGGTSLAGQTCNEAVVIDSSKYLTRVLSIDPDKRRARVQPGCILDHLRNTAERYHLTFGPDPATHDHNTLGGMIGNNSCGVHSVMAGRTADNVDTLDIVCYDGTRLKVGATSESELEQIIASGGRRGEIYAGMKRIRDRYADLIRKRFPKIPRLVSGYGLDELLPENGFQVARVLVGTEGTCVTVLEAKVCLVPSPPCRVLLLLGYADVYEAADAVPRIMQADPIALEGLDHRLIDGMLRKHLHPADAQLLPDGKGWLLAEFGADSRDEAEQHAKTLHEELKREGKPTSMRLLSDPKDQARVWDVRESGLGATAFVPGEPDAWTGWEDSAVPPDRLGDYLRDFRALLNKYRYEGAFYGHFGQGVLHTRITFDLKTTEGIEKWRSFLDAAADMVVRYGGSLSGEHGDGQQRAALLGKMFGPELLQAFREFKALWDPGNRMNPGKVVEPYPITSNLRLQTPQRPLDLKTHFSFRDDQGSFARAALRCVGVGKCRRHGGGVMCPSYMATHEEKHSTRGRARLLFEMIHEGALNKGWRSDAVQEALDLCLACKGCKHDCPVNVDMANYKAEFHAHYYKGRLRPRSAYAFGNIYWWVRLASHVPGLINGVSQSRWGSPLIKWTADIAPQRQLPRLAARRFTADYARHEPRSGARPVLLWPDTFNNHLTPAPLHAAVRVLTDAGFTPIVPPRPLCCGRPLYAWGWIDRAKRLLAQILDVLAPHIDAGIPLVGIEPACVTTFRDELLDLFPDDKRAQRLSSQSYLLSDFLLQQKYRPPRLERQALVHMHCYHRSVLGTDAEKELLSQLGLDFSVPDSGCCGMAGEFGFEASHYDVSIKCGERVLLPAVRGANDATWIVADGYSCREQIIQTTGRQPLHFAEVLDAAVQAREREATRRHAQANDVVT